jgi:hypothetical protein
MVNIMGTKKYLKNKRQNGVKNKAGSWLTNSLLKETYLGNCLI